MSDGPFNFDSTYDTTYDDSDDSIVEPAARVVDQIVQGLAASAASPPSDDVDDAYMEDVDERIEVAIHYRQLLKGRLFDVDTKETRIVEAEMRRFVRGRVKELVGLAGPQPTAPVLPFTSEEINALKLLAARLMTNPNVVQAKPKADPQVRKAPAPTTNLAPPRRTRTVAPAVPAPSVTPPTPTPTSTPTPPPAKVRGFKKVPAMDRDGNPITNEKGEPILITKMQQQNPAGRLPWPSDQQLTAMTEAAAMMRTPQPAVNIDHRVSESTANSNTVVAALAAAALQR